MNTNWGLGQGHGANNIVEEGMDHLQLEEGADMSLQPPAADRGSINHLINLICMWSLQEAKDDHPESLTPVTGSHVLKENINQ